MTEVYIKYNPYILETIFTVDGEIPKKNETSDLNKIYGSRLQEWIEELPRMLFEECNTKTFNVKFHGTVMDFEDVVSILELANKNEGYKFTCEHEPGKEVVEKEKAIKDIFAKIQQGPFEDLRTQALKEKFEETLSENFKVNVMATMSAGKSTLVNALLEQKLMPSSMEACTAKITEIKDEDKEVFFATAYDENGYKIKDYENLSLETMTELNKNNNVRNIKVVGDIPFTSSEEISLVLVDTPGPNNARNEEHAKITLGLLDGETKAKPPLILFILDAAHLGAGDADKLFNTVAEKMSVGGKQSKDRFLFVVNKLDEFKKDEDNVLESLNKVRKYLSEKGIENPNIFPASALTALNIRTIMKDKNVVGYDSEEIFDLDPEVAGCINKINKFFKIEQMHFEKYSSITPSVKMKLSKELEKLSQKTDKTNSNEVRSEALKKIALIHSGIIPLEESIDMYVRKYAKTAKIKSMIDSFKGTLEDSKVQAETEAEIAEKIKEGKKLDEQITAIESQIADGKKAKGFNASIDSMKFDVSFIDTLRSSAINEINKQQTKLGETYGEEITVNDAEVVEGELRKFASDLQSEIYYKLEKEIKEKIVEQGKQILDNYKESLKNLTDSLSISDLKVSPYKLVKGTLENIDVEKLIKIKETSEEVWVKREKTFLEKLKFWDWGTDYGYYKTVTHKNKYILLKDVAVARLSPLETNIIRSCNDSKKYALDYSKDIKELFKNEVIKLNDLLQKKYSALKECTKNKDNVEKMKKELEQKLKWIQQIEKEINDVLEV